MGQYFRVINIDKRQDFGHEGKFVEYFFSDSPRDLLFTLALGTNLPLKSGSHHTGLVLVGSWAGDRIICLGDYSEDDTPNGMLDDMELQEFTDPDYFKPDLYQFAMHYFKGFRLSTYDIPKLGSADDSVWVLRNLTKREYVRSDVDGLRRDIHAQYGCDRGIKPGLGHALVSRISWSPYVSINYHNSDKIARGVWAGDRFDVRTIDCLEDEDEDYGEWKDVSDEAVGDLLAIWDSEMDRE